MNDADTIAAVATPPGVSAVAIIRISGPRAHDIAAACFSPLNAASSAEPPQPGRARRGWLVDPGSGERLDQILVLRFDAPRSYSGEDVVELHVHGGAGVVGCGLALVLRLGARLAAPGEFTRRAFLNGRLDLAQAEAVADLIAAESERASKAAAYRLAGAAGAQLRALRAELLDRLIEVEAHVDYPDEVPEPDPVALAACVRAQFERVGGLLAGAGAARVLRDGVDCVIAGPPNAGKSSLLNALVECERAIVSDVPGTTRDVIEDRVAIDGVVLRLRDTAGLRRTRDAIEGEGVARAHHAIAQAQLVIAVLDASAEPGADERAAIEETRSKCRIVLANKLDLGSAGLDSVREMCGARDGTALDGAGADGEIFVAGSVRWPQTIATLRDAVAQLGWGGALDGSRALVAGARQIEALTRAQEALAHARATLEARVPVDLVCADLRDAAAAYGEVTGDTVTEEILEGIFARFCVGK